MALRPRDTTVSYRCPACGKSVVSVTGVFALTGDMIKLKCTCGESELLIKQEGEGKAHHIDLLHGEFLFLSAVAERGAGVGALVEARRTPYRPRVLDVLICM